MITDYHTHILPGRDDGARNKEESAALLAAAKKCGVKQIYATPHFYAHKTDVDTFCKRRQEAFAQIMDVKSEISVHLGAEVLLFPGLENLQQIDRLVMKGTNSLLVELPHSEIWITENHYLTAEKLQRRFQLIMAHANRYSDRVVEQLLDIGAVIQVNSHDVLKYGQRRRIHYWQQMGAKIILGSDTHRDEKNFYRLKKAVKYIPQRRSETEW